MPGVRLRVNGLDRVVEADPETPLLSALRGPLGLMGTRFGCGLNQCGACNVLLDGRAVASCDLPLSMQCGYCISGILISAAALLRRNPDPSEAEVRAALDRNLCRCGAHNRMVRAVLRAAKAEQPA
jgi:nicotinate dehydrogenase subunit A